MQDSARSIGGDGARIAKRRKQEEVAAAAAEKRCLRERGWADSAGGPPQTPKVRALDVERGGADWAAAGGPSPSGGCCGCLPRPLGRLCRVRNRHQAPLEKPFQDTSHAAQPSAPASIPEMWWCFIMINLDALAPWLQAWHAKRAGKADEARMAPKGCGVAPVPGFLWQTYLCTARCGSVCLRGLCTAYM